MGKERIPDRFVIGTNGDPIEARFDGERRRPGARPKKTQPPEATGFSEPCGGISDVEVTTRFELVNDGFAGRLPMFQKPLFFLGFLRPPKKISMEISIAFF